MHGQGPTLVLDHHAGQGLRQFVDFPAQRGPDRRAGDLRHRTVPGQAHLAAMLPGGRQPQRFEQAVEIGDRATADQGQGPVETLPSFLESLRQTGRHLDLARRAGNIQQRPIDIEKKSPGPVRHERHVT